MRQEKGAGSGMLACLSVPEKHARWSHPECAPAHPRGAYARVSLLESAVMTVPLELSLTLSVTNTKVGIKGSTSVGIFPSEQGGSKQTSLVFLLREI